MRRNDRFLWRIAAVFGFWVVLSGLGSVRRASVSRVMASEDFAFPVRTVRLEGVTAFRDSDLSPLVQGVIGQNVSLAQLESVAESFRGQPRA